MKNNVIISLILLVTLILPLFTNVESVQASSFFRIRSINNHQSNYTASSKLVATPVLTTASIVVAPPTSSTLQWGAYVGDGSTGVSDLESLVGTKMTIVADFEAFDATFPTNLSAKVGQQGKTLEVFWEPSTGFDSIINGSLDNSIKQFASGAKSYGYPVILVPFDEMNLNEEAWGYSINGNTAAKFVQAWQHVHDLFAGLSNVKFGLDFNNVSIPNIKGNQFSDYYPGSNYVDYVGVDGYNFGSPWQSVSQVFSSALAQVSTFGKPIYIFATASTPGTQKASWITSFGTYVKSYPNLQCWGMVRCQ